MHERQLKALADQIVSDAAHQAKVLDAEVRGNRWLAEGNAASEAGNNVRAEKCYAKGQFWLDRLNKLTGQS